MRFDRFKKKGIPKPLHFNFGKTGAELKRLDPLRSKIRQNHYSMRTEQTDTGCALDRR